MIVGTYVDASDESAAIEPMIAQHGSIMNAPPSRVLLDAGYHNLKVLELFANLELDVLCPSGKADRGEWNKSGREGKFVKGDFKFDYERDLYACPAGRELTRAGESRKHDRNCVNYRGRQCKGCELAGRCTDDKKGRTIKRNEGDELKEAMAKVFENERARKEYVKRKGMVEPVFSEMRSVQNLNRFHRCGLRKVRVEFALHCIAYNLRRAIRLGAEAHFWFIFGRDGNLLLAFGVVVRLFIE
jgi:hypothetical protein